MDYRKYLSKNAVDIPPSGIRKFFDIVAERPDAISLGVGEPDFDTPWVSREAAIKSIQKGYTQYTSNFGMPKLRELISKYYKQRKKLVAKKTIYRLSIRILLGFKIGCVIIVKT